MTPEKRAATAAALDFLIEELSTDLKAVRSSDAKSFMTLTAAVNEKLHIGQILAHLREARKIL